MEFFHLIAGFLESTLLFKSKPTGSKGDSLSYAFVALVTAVVIAAIGGAMGAVVYHENQRLRAQLAENAASVRFIDDETGEPVEGVRLHYYFFRFDSGEDGTLEFTLLPKHVSHGVDAAFVPPPKYGGKRTIEVHPGETIVKLTPVESHGMVDRVRSVKKLTRFFNIGD